MQRSQKKKLDLNSHIYSKILYCWFPTNTQDSFRQKNRVCEAKISQYVQRINNKTFFSPYLYFTRLDPSNLLLPNIWVLKNDFISGTIQIWIIFCGVKLLTRLVLSTVLLFFIGNGLLVFRPLDDCCSSYQEIESNDCEDVCTDCFCCKKTLHNPFQAVKNVNFYIKSIILEDSLNPFQVNGRYFRPPKNFSTLSA